MFDRQIFLLKHKVYILIFELLQVQIVGLTVAIHQDLRSKRNRRELNLWRRRDDEGTFHLHLEQIEMKTGSFSPLALLKRRLEIRIMFEDIILLLLVGVVEGEVDDERNDHHRHNNILLPEELRAQIVPETHAQQEEDDVGLLHLQFQFDRNVLLHLVVLVEVVLVDPVQHSQHHHEEEQQVGQVEDVEGVESPDVEHHHQLEFDREGRGRQFLVETLLAEHVRFGDLSQQSLPLLVEQSVAEIDDRHQDAHECETDDSHEELLQLDVVGDRSSEEIEGCRGEQVEEEVEDDGGHHDEEGLRQFRAGLSCGHQPQNDESIDNCQDDDQNGDDEAESSAQPRRVDLLLIDFDHGEVEDGEGQQHEANTEHSCFNSDLLLVGGRLPDILPVYFLRLGNSFGVVADGVALAPHYLADVMHKFSALVHLEMSMHHFLLLDSVEHHNYLLGVLVDVLPQQVHAVVQIHILAVLLPQLLELLLAVVAFGGLLQRFQLEEHIEEQLEVVLELAHAVDVEGLADFQLGRDQFHLLLEILQLVVERHVLDDEGETTEQLLLQTDAVLVDQLQEHLDADGRHHQNQVGRQLQVLQDIRSPLLPLRVQRVEQDVAVAELEDAAQGRRAGRLRMLQGGTDLLQHVDVVQHLHQRQDPEHHDEIQQEVEVPGHSSSKVLEILDDIAGRPLAVLQLLQPLAADAPVSVGILDARLAAVVVQLRHRHFGRPFERVVLWILLHC